MGYLRNRLIDQDEHGHSLDLTKDDLGVCPCCIATTVSAASWPATPKSSASTSAVRLHPAPIHVLLGRLGRPASMGRRLPVSDVKDAAEKAVDDFLAQHRLAPRLTDDEIAWREVEPIDGAPACPLVPVAVA